MSVLIALFYYLGLTPAKLQIHTRVITSAFGFQLLKSPINDADWKGRKQSVHWKGREIDNSILKMSVLTNQLERSNISKFL